jgi:hypothetical protein
MNTSMDQICAGYTEAELVLLADFVRRTTAAGRDATDELAQRLRCRPASSHGRRSVARPG